MAAKKKEAATVTEQLKEQIRGSGQTLLQLAEASGVSAGQLSRFLNGKRMLTGRAIDGLCSALGLRLVREAPAGRRRGKAKGGVRREPDVGPEA
jgi:transcriptional regulator with XRE-family HTH domain